jgi:ribosomal protein S21
MSNIARVRVDLKNKHRDPERNFREMFADFKRRVNTSGIMHDYKEHQYFESKSGKKRRKKKEAQKKKQMELLEKKVLSGERVKVPSGIVKKILGTDKKQRKSKRG